MSAPGIERRAIAAAEAVRAYRLALALRGARSLSAEQWAVRQEEARAELQVLAETLRDAGWPVVALDGAALLVAGKPLVDVDGDLASIEATCRTIAEEARATEPGASS